MTATRAAFLSLPAPARRAEKVFRMGLNLAARLAGEGVLTHTPQLSTTTTKIGMADAGTRHLVQRMVEPYLREGITKAAPVYWLYRCGALQAICVLGT